MEQPDPSVHLEQVLSHREWVRRLARALVRDENEADDLEQEFWVDALRSLPRAGSSIRGWITLTLRHNLVDRLRSEARRRRREDLCAGREAVPASADVVAEADAHKRVVLAVMDLPEPYRTTVLHRYFQDLRPGGIAARQGVPVETVRTRLKRALEMLRRRLEAEQGGNRGAWTVGLLPLAGDPAPPAGPAVAGAVGPTNGNPGGTIVKTSNAVAVAAGLLLAGGLAWWLASTGPSSPVEVAGTGVPAGGAGPSSEPGGPRLPAARAEGEPGDLPVPVPVPPTVPEAPPGAPPTAGAEEPTALPAPPGEIVGRVLLLKDRSPVGGATVTLRAGRVPAPGGIPFEPRTHGTDVSGGFGFFGVPEGGYVVGASLEGYAPREIGGVTVTAERGAGGIVILLTAGGGIEGRVTGSQGEGLEGIEVRTSLADGPLSTLTTRTDSDGRYRFENLGPDRHLVQAVRGKDRVQTVFVAVAEGGIARADFGAAGAVTGLLLDPGGLPVSRATIGFTRIGGRGMVNVKTDDEGRFRADGLSPGEWLVQAMLHDSRPQVIDEKGFSGFSSVVGRVKVSDLDQDLVLRLEGGEIAGRVIVKSTGGPVAFPDVTLQLYGAGGGGDFRGNALAGRDGTFRFRGLGPGTYRLVAHPVDTSLRRFEQEVALASGEVREGFEVAFEGLRTGTVRFRVRDPDGKPVEGAEFSILGGFSFVPARGAPGIYSAALEVGKRSVRIAREDHQGVTVVVDVLEEGTAEVEATLPWGGVASHGASGEIAGRVFSRATGKPVAFPAVALSIHALVPGKGGGWIQGTHAGVALPQEDGLFRLTGLKAGRFRILANPNPPVFRRVQVDVDLPREGNREVIEIGLEECGTGTVRFTVRDPDGKPVEGARFSTVSGPTRTSLQAKGLEGGVYEVLIEEGKVTVSVFADGVGSGRAEISVEAGGTQEVEVVLRGKGG